MHHANEFDICVYWPGRLCLAFEFSLGQIILEEFRRFAFQQSLIRSFHLYLSLFVLPTFSLPLSSLRLHCSGNQNIQFSTQRVNQYSPALYSVIRVHLVHFILASFSFCICAIFSPFIGTWKHLADNKPTKEVFKCRKSTIDYYRIRLFCVSYGPITSNIIINLDGNGWVSLRKFHFRLISYTV